MTKLRYRPPFLAAPAFAEWQKRATAARDAMVAAKKKPDSFNARLWQDFKNEFLIPMGVCAYCEGRYVAGDFCDAEHYRPKGEVTEGRNAVAHPGYYWLAYEWHNLLLACKKCNSSHADRDKTTRKQRVSHPGKLCEFPIGAARIVEPSVDPNNWMDDLCAEDPRLLHPYLDAYHEHFEAKLDGWIYHLTERGRVTIEVCDLNRKELRAERRNAEQHVEGKVASIWSKHLLDVDWSGDLYGLDTAFCTYLNCKVKEELRRKALDLAHRAQTIGL